MVYLVSWLAGWMIDWVVTDWWIGVYHGFVGCLIDQSVDQLNDWLVIKQLITINLLNEKIVIYTSNWLTDCSGKYNFGHPDLKV